MNTLIQDQTFTLPIAPLLQALGMSRATYYRKRPPQISLPDAAELSPPDAALAPPDPPEQQAEEPDPIAPDPLAPSRCRVPGRAHNHLRAWMGWAVARNSPCNSPPLAPAESRCHQMLQKPEGDSKDLGTRSPWRQRVGIGRHGNKSLTAHFSSAHAVGRVHDPPRKDGCRPVHGRALSFSP